MMKDMKRLFMILLVSSMVMTAFAGDTIYYTLQQCRDLALTSGASSKAQEETRLAAKYNRQAALASMFPRITANGSYMWNSRDAHMLANSTSLPFGTATVNPDGTASFEWSDASTLGKIETAAKGTVFREAVCRPAPRLDGHHQQSRTEDCRRIPGAV